MKKTLLSALAATALMVASATPATAGGLDVRSLRLNQAIDGGVQAMQQGQWAKAVTRLQQARPLIKDADRQARLTALICFADARAASNADVECGDTPVATLSR
ncbi:hypothetical protein [Yunchengibacter salinarum]|uniref:hypothetical protein n=1 Tax=Yunchengibacter salinarum TaxID=3133399 RepID=UPI0035B69CF5